MERKNIYRQNENIGNEISLSIFSILTNMKNNGDEKVSAITNGTLPDSVYCQAKYFYEYGEDVIDIEVLNRDDVKLLHIVFKMNDAGLIKTSVNNLVTDIEFYISDYLDKEALFLLSSARITSPGRRVIDKRDVTLVNNILSNVADAISWEYESLKYNRLKGVKKEIFHAFK